MPRASNLLAAIANSTPIHNPHTHLSFADTNTTQKSPRHPTHAHKSPTTFSKLPREDLLALSLVLGGTGASTPSGSSSTTGSGESSQNNRGGWLDDGWALPPTDPDTPPTEPQTPVNDGTLNEAVLAEKDAWGNIIDGWEDIFETAKNAQKGKGRALDPTDPDVKQWDNVEAFLKNFCDTNRALTAQLEASKQETARALALLQEAQNHQKLGHELIAVTDCHECNRRHVAHCPCCPRVGRSPPRPRTPTGSLRSVSRQRSLRSPRKVRSSPIRPKKVLRSFRLKPKVRPALAGAFQPNATPIAEDPVDPFVDAPGSLPGAMWNTGPPANPTPTPVLMVFEAPMEVEDLNAESHNPNGALLHPYRELPTSRPESPELNGVPEPDDIEPLVIEGQVDQALMHALARCEIRDRAGELDLQWEMQRAATGRYRLFADRRALTDEIARQLEHRLNLEVEERRAHHIAEAERIRQEEENRRARIDRRARLRAEALARLQAQEDRRQAEEYSRREAEEEHRARLRVEVDLRRYQEELERRQAEEQLLRQAEEEHRRLQAEEERRRLQAEEEHRRLQAEGEHRRLQAEEELRVRQAEEEIRARLQAEEEHRRHHAELERRQAEEKLRLRQAEEERLSLPQARRQRQEQEIVSLLEAEAALLHFHPSEEARQAREAEERRLLQQIDEESALSQVVPQRTEPPAAPQLHDVLPPQPQPHNVHPPSPPHRDAEALPAVPPPDNLNPDGLPPRYAAALAKAQLGHHGEVNKIVTDATNLDPFAQVSLVLLALPEDTDPKSFAYRALARLVNANDLLREAIGALGRRARDRNTHAVQALQILAGQNRLARETLAALIPKAKPSACPSASRRRPREEDEDEEEAEGRSDSSGSGSGARKIAGMKRACRRQIGGQ
jgi:hypothetical protein